MRYRWIYGAAAIVTMLAVPAMSQAQSNPCDAYSADTSGGTPAHPTCSITKNATATIGNILILGVVNGDVNLIAGVAAGQDTVPFARTFHADSLAAGGTDMTAHAASLYKSTDTSVVVAQGNRGYVVNVKAQDPIFEFDKSTGGVCRSSSVATTCQTSETLAGKDIGDVYLHFENGPAAGWNQLKTSDTQLFTTSTGARFTTGVEMGSAWYYASDIAGNYTATLVYTITGQ